MALSSLLFEKTFKSEPGPDMTPEPKHVPLEDKGVIKAPNAHIGMNTTPRERRRLFKIFKLPTLQIMYIPFAFTLGVGVEEFNP